MLLCDWPVSPGEGAAVSAWRDACTLSRSGFTKRLRRLASHGGGKRSLAGLRLSIGERAREKSEGGGSSERLREGARRTDSKGR